MSRTHTVPDGIFSKRFKDLFTLAQREGFCSSASRWNSKENQKKIVEYLYDIGYDISMDNITERTFIYNGKDAWCYKHQMRYHRCKCDKAPINYSKEPDPGEPDHCVECGHWWLACRCVPEEDRWLYDGPEY